MRKFPNHIGEIITESKLKLNIVSKASGISHTYLTKLVTGNINQPGKDKIASIMLALNYSIGEINALLAHYDYQPLSVPDIPQILANNRKRKVEGAIMACFDHVYLDLLLESMERIGGTKIILKDRPSALFMPDDLYLKNDYPFSYETDHRAEDFHHAFTRALLRSRKTLFLKNCRDGCRFETYICKQCLNDYLKRNLSASDNTGCRRLIVRYFANALGAARKSPSQHITKIVARCAYFHMQIQDADGANPKINFPGRKPHVYNNPSEQLNLEGFTTDAPPLVAIFKKEIDLCNSSTVQAIHSDYPNGLIAYMLGLFESYGLCGALERTLDWVCAQDELPL